MSHAEQLAQLAKDTWENTLDSYPELATILGDGRGDDRLTDNSPEGRQQRLDETKAFLERLNAIDKSQLNDTDQITHDILRIDYESGLEGEKYNFHLWSIDQLNGLQVGFPGMVQNFHPKKTSQDWHNLVKRYDAFAVKMEHYLGYLKEGAEKGYAAPRIAVERVIGQLEGMLAGEVEDSLFAKVADKIPEDIEDRAVIAEAIKAGAKDKVLPAFESMRTVLKEHCLPKARNNTGLWENPQGLESYAYLVKNHLGKAMDPQEIHDIGLRELESIRAEMDEIAKAEGMERMAYARKLTEDSDNFHSTREALLEEYEALVRKAEARLPELFNHLPKQQCKVRSIDEFQEKDAPTGYYMPPSEDGSRAGTFWANTYKPETRMRSNMSCLTYHEAVPGHHLQIALALEMDMPEVRRHGRFTAFVEGWALYTERLCDEVGLYELPRDRFGMLGYQAWRATRLVVDTGLHALKWTREQALEFMNQNTVLPQSEVENEVDRYLVMPGQALSYKIGEIEIRNIRQEAKDKLGDRFDLKGFHDTLIGSGAIPLDTMNRLLRNWIEAKAA